MTRSHFIAWRDDLVVRSLSGMTIRHRLAALSSLFEHLCERNAVTHNPVKGVKRPPVESYQGKTPALGDHQARALLEAPDGVSLKGKRDRAILATLPYHALRREELCKLTVEDFRHERRGVAHLKVSGKDSKTRHVPLHPAASGLIFDYLEADGRGLEAVDLWDSIPRYAVSRARMNALRTVEGFFEALELPCNYRGKPLMAVIHPARTKDKNGARVSCYPSAREEVIEHSLRGLSAEQRAGFVHQPT